MMLRTFIFAVLLTSATLVHGQSTAFTYQGVLNTSGSPANGIHEFQFRIFDAPTGGSQVGSTLTLPNVPVTAGSFTVELNFGGLFSGPGRFLEIAVKPGGGASFTILAPRSPFTSAPYAIKSLESNVSSFATNSTQLNGQPAAFYQNAANLNAGTLDAARLPVPLSLTGSVASGGVIQGTNSNTSGLGVFGAATATTGHNFGGFFESASTNGRGVFGLTTATTGLTFGVAGQSNSPQGFAGYFLGRGYFSDDVGIGTFPRVRLHVTDGTDAEPGSGGFIVAGTLTSTNLVLDNNEIMARNDGAVATLALNADGGNIHLIQGGTGNVGIGTSSPDQKLSVNGGASKPGGGSWATFSDERLKNIKGNFTPGLDAVMRLQPVLYSYKTVNDLGITSDGEHVGFSAQAVEKVIPEAVSKNDKGYRLVNNDPILWAMLNAAKEQQLLIESQKTEIELLKKKVAVIDELTKLLCVSDQSASVCKEKK